jgi:hypothetical protein
MTERTFKSYSEAMKGIAPNLNTMKNIGERTKKHCIFRLENNQSSGKELADSTIDKKINRGAKTPFIKLVEGGGLSDQMKVKATLRLCKIGYFSETHKKFKSYDQSIKVCDLAKIHHEGLNGIPARKFLEVDDEVREIIRDEIEKRIRGLT